MHSLNPYTLNPFPGHRSAQGNEKGKKKKDMAKGRRYLDTSR